MLFDTHCHLNFKDFKDDAPEVIARTLAAGTWMNLVGSELKTSARAIEYADKYPEGVYASIGLHPIHLEDILIKNDNENGKYEFRAHAEKFDALAFRQLAQSSKKVIAIGEIGLDYYHLNKDGDIPAIKNRQQEVFKEQMVLAAELSLPIIIHCREAHDDLMPIVDSFKEKHPLHGKRPWGVVHCYSGDLQQAEKYWQMGLLISFTGIITFAKQWDDLIKAMPLDKFLIETDSPYLSPAPFRGQRNEPLHVEQVARRIAELKGLSFEEIAEASSKNAKNLFQL